MAPSEVPTLPKLRIIRELGRGASGRVYLALDEENDRHVAAKVLMNRPGSPEAAQRFLEEISNTAKLPYHPNLVPLYQRGVVDDPESQFHGAPYYVMPWVDGESLQERIGRGTLKVEEAVEIALKIATALHHAHARQLVHRDVKPANVLLDDDGNVYLSDFGIALAVERATEARFTESGSWVGTPLYVSPEQIQDVEVDGRADLYSLGCTLYEMLTGSPPFTARAPHALTKKHLTDDPPGLPAGLGVPPSVEETLMRALAKDPADRMASAAAFIEQLRSASATLAGPDDQLEEATPKWSPGTTRSRWTASILATALIVVAAALGPRFFEASPSSTGGGGGLDSLTLASTFAVIPLEPEGGSATQSVLQRSLTEELTSWGLGVAADRRIGRATAQYSGDALTIEEASGVAQSVGADMFVLWESGADPGSPIRIELYDARQEVRLSPPRAEFPPNADSVMVSAAVAGLLFGRAPAVGEVTGPAGTRSWLAAMHYVAADQAVVQWDLAAADARLSQATAFDPDFVLAALRLAQVRNWARDSVAVWRRPLTMISGRTRVLSPEDATYANALTKLADREYPEACELYESLPDTGRYRIPRNYGLGECITRDHYVVPVSAGQWQRRRSYWEGMQAYSRAFMTLAETVPDLDAEFFEGVRSSILTRSAYLYVGTDGAASFKGWPVRIGDSVVVAYAPDHVDPQPSTYFDALGLMRDKVMDIALTWHNADTANAAAMRAVAHSYELLGDPRALEWVERALARSNEEQRFRLRAEEVWLLVKYGAEGDSARLTRARRTATALLEDGVARDVLGHSVLAGLAAISGRPLLAAAYADTAVASQPRPPVLTQRENGIRARLEVLAATGIDRPELRRWEAELLEDFRNRRPQSDSVARQRRALGLASVLAYPERDFGHRVAIDTINSLPLAQERHAALDMGGAQEVLSGLAIDREDLLPRDLTLDVLYPEARLWVATGGLDEARRWLSPTLNDLRWIEPELLRGRNARAASLVPAMILLSRLERAVGSQADADRWNEAATILWGGGDALAESLLASLKEPLTSGGG